MRLLLAFAVFAFAIGLGAEWMSIHDLWVAPTPAMGPEKWDKLLILVVWLIGAAAVAQWLRPPRASDFGGGVLAYFVAAIGAALSLGWLSHILELTRANPPPSLSDTSVVMIRFILFAFAVVTVTRWMMMHHKRRTQAARNRRPDQGPYSVYLRPFELDTAMDRWSRGAWYESIGIQLQRTHSMEEALAELVDRHCPLVAVGDSVVGAKKLHATDESWRAQVEDMLRDAAIVFFIPGPSPGALWEAERLADPSVYRLQKTFWLMPPKSEFGQGFGIEEFWERTRASAAQRQILLPPYRERGGVYTGHQYYSETTQQYGVELQEAPEPGPELAASSFMQIMARPWQIEPRNDFMALLRAALLRPFNPVQHYLSAIFDASARAAQTAPFGLPLSLRDEPPGSGASD